jgi:hypothetical protein
MRLQIRRGIFETNSSSTHSITMVMKSDYDRWRNGELYMYDGELMEKSVAIKKVNDNRFSFNENPNNYTLSLLTGCETDKELANNAIYSFEEYFDDEYESFNVEFTTPSGETVCSFGYYGNDY